MTGTPSSPERQEQEPLSLGEQLAAQIHAVDTFIWQQIEHTQPEKYVAYRQWQAEQARIASIYGSDGQEDFMPVIEEVEKQRAREITQQQVDRGVPLAAALLYGVIFSVESPGKPEVIERIETLYEQYSRSFIKTLNSPQFLNMYQLNFSVDESELSFFIPKEEYFVCIAFRPGQHGINNLYCRKSIGGFDIPPDELDPGLEWTLRRQNSHRLSGGRVLMSAIWMKDVLNDMEQNVLLPEALAKINETLTWHQTVGIEPLEDD